MSENPDMVYVCFVVPCVFGVVRWDMTRRLVRWQTDGDLHLVTISCEDRKPWLVGYYALAENALERMRVRFELDVVGYVLMPEHVHLLVSEPSPETGLLADAVKMFKLSVTLRQGRRPFWMKRYHDRNLVGDDAMVDCLRYVHRNPLRRGLVQEPEAWRWSSYRHYYLREQGVVGVDSGWSREEVRWSLPAGD